MTKFWTSVYFTLLNGGHFAHGQLCLAESDCVPVKIFKTQVTKPKYKLSHFFKVLFPRKKKKKKKKHKRRRSSKHIKGSKGRYLLGQNTTYEFSG